MFRAELSKIAVRKARERAEHVLHLIGALLEVDGMRIKLDLPPLMSC